MTPEQEKVSSLITDTVILLCRTGLAFESEIKLQGTLAVTVDSKHFFVIKIDDVVNDKFPSDVSESRARPKQLGTISFGVKHEADFAEKGGQHHKKPRLSSAASTNSSHSTKAFSLQKVEPDDASYVKFSEGFPSLAAAPVKAEDDDLILVNMSRNPDVGDACNNYGDAGGSFEQLENRELCDGSQLATASSNTSNAKQRTKRKRASQENLYSQWAGPDESSFAAYYGMTDSEYMQDLESADDIAEISDDDKTWNFEGAEGDNSSELSGGASFTCQYSDCGKTFNYSYTLRRHQRQVHGCVFGADREVVFFCHISGCKSTFRSQAALGRHRKKMHGISD